MITTINEWKRHSINESIETKIQKKVDEINDMISKAVDTEGDKLGVYDASSTWEAPMYYDKIEFKNGKLKISYEEYTGHKPEKKSEVISKKDLELDGIGTLNNIAKMYKKAIKKANKFDKDTNESNVMITTIKDWKVFNESNSDRLKYEAINIVKFKGKEFEAVFGRYPNGRIAIILVDSNTGEKYAVATVNLPAESIDPRNMDHEMAIKTYGENEGIDKALIEAGILADFPNRIINTGMVQVPVYSLRNDNIRHIN